MHDEETIEQLLAALPEVDEPDDWLSAPEIRGWWWITSPNGREVAAEGWVFGSSQFPDAAVITTSALRAVDADRRWIITQNNIYRLGRRLRFRDG